MNIDRIVDLGSSSEDEDRFYLDPSDPRAHEKTKDDDSDDMSNGQKKKHISSQKDKPLSSKALSRNENRHGNTSSSSSSLVPSLTTTIDLSLDVPKKSSKTLSKWAQKFLTTKRTIVSLDEMPIEAAQDFILTAFSQSKMERNEDDMQDDSTPPNSEDENEDETTTSTKKGMGLGRPLCHVPGSANEFQNVSSNRPRPHHNTNERKNTPYKQKVDARYFRPDVQSKCYNCGEVGHMSSHCVNTRKVKVCMYCGKPGHLGNYCPSSRCFACYKTGHESRNCPNRHEDMRHCGVCGNSGHVSSTCPIEEDQFIDIHCMVCGEADHSSCIAPRPESRELCCPNCTRKHKYEDCQNSHDEVSYNYPRNNNHNDRSSSNNHRSQGGNNRPRHQRSKSPPRGRHHRVQEGQHRSSPASPSRKRQRQRR